MGAGYILREEGTRENPENIQERPKREGNRLYAAGWVNWHAKCEKLKFYHDEEDKIIRPKRLQLYDERIKEWEALLPYEQEVKPKGNLMTQKYYVDQDNDYSHGHAVPKGQTKSLAGAYRKANWIDIIIHPPQLPDLNPIKACWNIIKQRIRYREEWSKMPERCEMLVNSGGKPIKSKLW
ncbi:hypothetical protein V2W45_1494927 [Cenococcum geophilum]